MKNLAKCPSCLFKIEIGRNQRPYQRITCPECETFLEIVKTNPPTLDWAFSDSEEFYDNLEFAAWVFK